MLNHSWRLRLVTGVLAGLVTAPAAVVLGSDPGRSFTHRSAQGSDPGRSITHRAPADIDEWILRAMKTFGVPGLALTIVEDGQVLLAKGYGVRKLGDGAPVDARTLLGIASNTKAFTATALGMLVEEGKIRWDGRVIDYLPWFQMYDPYVTREMTVRDLLVHRSGLGLGAGDLLWWPASTYDRHEIARRLRYIPLATSFRSAYAYDNVLYLVAGEVIEAVSGQSWEDFVSSRILAKVGMRSSNVRHSAARQGGNIATPHASVDGRLRPIAPFDSDNTNPAGGINSCAEDMARWLIVQLAEGQLPGGSRLFSPATSRQLMTIVTPIPLAEGPAELRDVRPNFNGYGLGFGLRDSLESHGRAAWLRIEGRDAAVTEARGLGADEPGIGCGVRLDRQPRIRFVPAGAADGLDRGLRGNRTPCRTVERERREADSHRA